MNRAESMLLSDLAVAMVTDCSGSKVRRGLVPVGKGIARRILLMTKRATSFSETATFCKIDVLVLAWHKCSLLFLLADKHTNTQTRTLTTYCIHDCGA